MTRWTNRIATMAATVLVGGGAVAAQPASAGPTMSNRTSQTTCYNLASEPWKLDATRIAAAMQVTCDLPVQFEPYLIVYVIYPDGRQRSFIRQPFGATTGTDSGWLATANPCPPGSNDWYQTHAYVKMDGWWELIDDSNWVQIAC